MEDIVKKIKELNYVPFFIEKEYFNGKDYKYVRNWLKEHNLNPHMKIEAKSAGIIIVVGENEDKRVLLQIRGTEKSRIGIFGGGIEANESPVDSAIRELKEGLGLEVTPEQLEYMGNNKHELVYQNGDVASYYAEVFLLRFQEFPFIKLDYESNGIVCINKNTLKDYINLADKNSLQIYDYWLEFINKALK